MFGVSALKRAFAMQRLTVGRSYKADRASGIYRVGIENLLVLFATRAAGRLIARRSDDPNRPSVGTAGAGRTSGSGRTSRQFLGQVSPLASVVLMI
jgi:hypothetical protein